MKKISKKIWLWAAAAALILICAALFLLKGGSGGGKGSMPAGMGMGPEESSETVVRAGTPITGDLNLTTGLTGTVEPSDVVYVYAKASGDVTDVKVKAGDTVEKGQVLVEIDTEQVDTAKNSLDSAAVSLSEAQSNLSRMKILYDGGDLSDQEYEQYTNKVKSAQLQYQSAKLAYEKQVEYSSVTAPISGTIESCDVEVYDRVSMNSQLCVITGAGEKTVSFYVTQRMLQNVELGDLMTIEKNGKSYNAHISEISSMVDSATGMFKIEAQLETTDEIATGSTVKLQLVTDKAENAMLIPVDAVYYSNGDAYVYLFEEGKARMTQVEVGLYDSQYAEILSGLSASDIVVSTWSSNLYEGAGIQLLENEETQTAVQKAAGDAAAESDAKTEAADEKAAEDAAAETAAKTDEETQAADGIVTEETEEQEG